MVGLGTHEGKEGRANAQISNAIQRHGTDPGVNMNQVRNRGNSLNRNSFKPDYFIVDDNLVIIGKIAGINPKDRPAMAINTFEGKVIAAFPRPPGIKPGFKALMASTETRGNHRD